MMIAALFVFVAVAAVGALVFVATRAASKVQASYERSNEVVPGIPSPAPTSWLGSHDLEAKLHRRLIDAMKALRTNQSFDQDGSLLDLRVELEHEAVTLDAELVSVAALPVHVRQEPLATLTGAVETIESAVAGLALSSAAGAGVRLERLLEDLRHRTSTVAQARAALDEIDDATPVTPERERPEEEPPATQPSSG